MAEVEADHGHHIDGESLIILFCIVCLVVSMVSKEINQRWGIPYTPLLIIFGIFIGYQKFLSLIDKGVEKINGIEPHAILMIFLPILIFESSFNARLPSLSTNALQVLSLIIPAVIITALLISVALKTFIGYAEDDLNWWEALTLGAILAATDPVAVVALLKELGAPIHINTIVEMESLFNDGTAMVFFTIFNEFAQGNSMDIGESIVLFLRLALGGVGLGILFGMGALLLLFFFKKGQTLFLHIIILGAYSVFYVGETQAKVSGLLAIVGLGLFLNKFMKNHMTVSQVHSAELIISYVQYLNESLLFFFAGSIIGFELSNEFTTLQDSDWGYTIVLYIFVVLIRFVSILILMPTLYWTGEGFDMKELILSVWGGLRGALGIALALSVFVNYEEESDPKHRRAGSLILFHTCGVAALTLLVNGTTAKTVVNELNIIRNVDVRSYFKGLFLKQVKKSGQEQLAALKLDPSFSMAFWGGVDDIVQFDQIDNERKHIKMFKSNIISKYQQKLRDHVSQHRFRIMRHMVKFLSDDQHEAYFFNSNYGVVEEAILQCCEKPDQNIKIWERCNRNLRLFRAIDSINKRTPNLRNVPVVGHALRYFNYMFLDEKFMILDILHGILHETMKLERDYAKKSPEGISLLSELQSELNLVEEELNLLKHKYSEDLQRLNQQHAAVKILRTQSHFLDSRIGSLIAEKEGTALRDELFAHYDRVSHSLVPFRLVGGKELILQTAFKELLDLNQIHQISSHKTVESFKSGEEVISKNDPSMCVIMNGQVEERLFINETDYRTLILAPGYVAGLANIIERDIKIAIVALSDVEVIKVELDLNISERFASFCYKRSLPEFLKVFSNDPVINGMSTIELKHISNDVEILIDVDSFVPNLGAFVFAGRFQRIDGMAEHNKYELVDPEHVIWKSKSQRNVVALFKQVFVSLSSVRETSNHQRIHPQLTEIHEEKIT